MSFFGISQPAVSQHLKILPEANLVRAERRGCWIHYSANVGKMGEFTDILSEIIRGTEEKVTPQKIASSS